MNKSNIYTRILNFWSQRNDWFTVEELIESVNPNEWEEKIIRMQISRTLTNWESKMVPTVEKGWYMWQTSIIPPHQSTLFVVSEKNEQITKFLLSHEAFLSYIDFLELEAAMKTWNEAKIIAIISIMIAILTWAFQISKDSILLNWITNFF